MTPTRPWTLLAVAAACALVAWLVVRSSFASFPTLPWSGAPALVVLAVAEALSGRNLRARIEGRRSGKPLAPIAVARMAVLAKASSMGAAAFGGIAAGLFAYTAGLLNMTVPRGDAINTGITAAAAGVLVAAALYLERCCRAPSRGDDDGE
jgi:Protein of unknown function (DUF3180)